MPDEDVEAQLANARSTYDELLEQYQRDLARLPELETQLAAAQDRVTELEATNEALVVGYREQIARLVAGAEPASDGDAFVDEVK